MTAKELGNLPSSPCEIRYSRDGKPVLIQTGSDSILESGLTKREYFAGLAMQGLLACPVSKVTDIIRSSVIYADTLLGELAKENQS